jgi:hypothetical protein
LLCIYRTLVVLLFVIKSAFLAVLTDTLDLLLFCVPRHKIFRNTLV